MKEIGQLKLINTRSGGKGEEVVRYVVPNWIAFVKRVEAEAGWKNTPSKPQIGFLLQHVGIAANMIAPKKAQQEQEAPKGFSLPQPVQLISQATKPAEKPKNMAELLKVFDED